MTDGARQMHSDGAVVIAFPRRPDRPQPDRLERALANLLRASEEQAAAVALWRATLADLGASMTDLAGSVGRYQTALTETAARVETLGDQARRVDAIMR